MSTYIEEKVKREYDYFYDSVHKWLRKHYGKATKCEHCGVLKYYFRYEYALRKGKQYEKKRENFIQLCKKCHVVYDEIIERLTEKKYKSVTAIKDGVEYRFNSITDASISLHVLKTSISNCLHGRSLTAGKYKWKYA